MVSQLRTVSGASSVPPKIRRHPLLHTIEGTVQVFTSPHRSFFTNVMVQALRAAEQGLPVLIVQFLKGGIGQGPTQPMQMGQNLTWLRCDYPGCISEPAVPEEAEAALQALWQHTQTVVNQGKYGLVVLDELSLAIEFGLLQESDVLIFLKERPPQIEMVLTGPKMPDALITIADQVTEFRRNYLL